MTTVLSGDPADVKAILDSLPLDSVISYGSGTDFTAAIHVRPVTFVGKVWYETAFTAPADSASIALNQPITVWTPREVSTAAELDALPERAVVTSEAYAFTVFLKAEGEWFQSGRFEPVPSDVLARYHAPLVVIR